MTYAPKDRTDTYEKRNGSSRSLLRQNNLNCFGRLPTGGRWSARRGLPENIRTKLIAGYFSAGGVLDVDAALSRHLVTCSPATNGWRLDVERGGQRILTAEDFDNAVEG
jgi:hypothetical protein